MFKINELKNFISKINLKKEINITENEILELKKHYEWNEFINSVIVQLEKTKKINYNLIKWVIDSLLKEVKDWKKKMSEVVNSIWDFFRKTKVLIETWVEVTKFTFSVIVGIILFTGAIIVMFNPITWMPVLLIFAWYSAILDKADKKIKWEYVEPKELTKKEKDEFTGMVAEWTIYGILLQFFD